MPASNDIRVEQVLDPRRIEIAPGFVAVHHSSRVREALGRMIRSGGTVFGALQGATLVGYVADVPYDSTAFGPGEDRRRWPVTAEVRECAIEVARGFRDRGLARRLLQRSTSRHELDRAILIGQALAWHWDLAHAGLTAFEYRGRLLALLASAGFRWYDTNEPEVTATEENFLVARVGRDVSADDRRAFESALFE